MTSLPIVLPASDNASIVLTAPQEESEQFLLRAFRSFAEASSSLERSYGMLRSEVERLHAELARSNAGLARSLEENRAMRRHLDRTLEGLPCGVLVAETDGAISLLNPEGRRLLGSIWRAASRDAPSEFESLQSMPGELRELLQRARLECGEQEHCFTDEEEGGVEHWLAARHAAVRETEKDYCETLGGNGNKAHSDAVSVFILRDVSEVKRLMREGEKRKREQALAEISAILAHEIRNPLGSLELFAGLLAGSGLSPECRDWVERVQAGLRTLSATVNNVLHFHSLPRPERTPTDLGQLLDWAEGFLAPMARQARVELCVRNRLRGVWFDGDRHRLEQVLLNLVLNALRAMPGGGWVELSGYKLHHGDAPAAAITVSDTGPGIQPEQIRKIFEAGFSTRAGSPGLGLAVCRKIVEQHGGWLEASNRAGAGASFRWMFPLHNGSREVLRGSSLTTGENTALRTDPGHGCTG